VKQSKKLCRVPIEIVHSQSGFGRRAKLAQLDGQLRPSLLADRDMLHLIVDRF
jgi:hypothetical protein